MTSLRSGRGTKAAGRMRFYKDIFYKGTFYIKDRDDPDKYLLYVAPVEYFETKRDWRKFSRNDWVREHIEEIGPDEFAKAVFAEGRISSIYDKGNDL